MTLAGFWFIALVVLWTGFLVLEGFDFGVGMLHAVVGRDEQDRGTVIGSIAPVWDGNEVWLIVAVAGTFAAFPGWYATMLSAFYPLFLLLLVGLIARGVSFEFRAHAGDARARSLWSGTLTAGSLLVPLVVGIVLGNLLHGVPIDSAGEFVGGFADLVSAYALVTGVVLALLCLVHGAMFLALRTTGQLRARAVRCARVFAVPLAVVVIGWVFWTRFGYGRGDLLSVVELIAVIAVVVAAVQAVRAREGTAFAATTVTVAAFTISIFDELNPRVMVSSLGPANDLTVAGTASATYSLTVMTVVLAVLLPVVLAYQYWTYRVFRRRLGGPPPAAGEPATRPGDAAPAGPVGTAGPAGARPAPMGVVVGSLAWAAAIVLWLRKSRSVGRPGGGRRTRAPA